MKQQFTIQAVTDCTIEYEGTIEYSIDNGKTWKRLKKLSIQATREAQFRNAKSESEDSFIIEGKFNVYGHISTLAPYGTEAFKWMFHYTNVVDASKLILDYDELWPFAYYNMFNGCRSLAKAPKLPATTLADSCYYAMFYYCSSLTTAPELPATTLAEECYQYMFNNCTSLASAPELPATTLAEGCYEGMFQGCKSLTLAPSLPATKLKEGCYEHMFQDCENIEELPLIPKKVLMVALRMDLLT